LLRRCAATLRCDIVLDIAARDRSRRDENEKMRMRLHGAASSAVRGALDGVVPCALSCLATAAQDVRRTQEREDAVRTANADCSNNFRGFTNRSLYRAR
jgi:hypothetical protein